MAKYRVDALRIPVPFGHGPGPTSSNRMMVMLIFLKAIDLDRLRIVLARAEALATGRDIAADDAALRQFGDVDPVDWSIESVRALMAECI